MDVFDFSSMNYKTKFTMSILYIRMIILLVVELFYSKLIFKMKIFRHPKLLQNSLKEKKTTDFTVSVPLLLCLTDEIQL